MCTQFGNHSLLVLSLSLLYKLLDPCRQGLYHFTTEALLILHQYRQPSPSLGRATQVMCILNHQQPIKGLTKLEYLGFRGTQVTDAGLVHLKELANLRTLDLDKTKTADAGLVHLQGLTNLTHLGFHSTQVTDAGLVHLKGLTKLESLSLGFTQITDAGLEHLKGLKNLERLYLQDTKVTEAGVADLQKALPNCKIDH